MTRRGLSFALLFLTIMPVLAQPGARKPPIPPGPPTRLPALALFSTGIDYTRPGIAARLARDGEGDVIGWDAIDADVRPYMRDGPATVLIEIAPTLVAPFRIDFASKSSLESALAVLARTPVQVAVLAAVPETFTTRSNWDTPFAALSDVLFIVPAGVGVTEPARARNVIVVAPLPLSGRTGVDLLLGAAATTHEAPLGSGRPSTADEAAMLLPGVFACLDLKAARSPADVKATLIAKAAKGPPGSPPLLGLCR